MVTCRAYRGGRGGRGGSILRINWIFPPVLRVLRGRIVTISSRARRLEIPYRVGASKELSEQPAKPARDADECSRSDRRIRLIAVRVAVRVQRQPDAGRERRAVHVIGQTADAGRAATANRQIENLLGDLGHAVEDRAAAGQHNSRVQAPFIAGAADLVPDEMKDFLGARLKDFG